jgi:hypothetical protein
MLYQNTKFRRMPYQRSPDRQRSKSRRQMLAATSPLSARMAAPLTPCQLAYARFLADETARSGDCRKSLDEIAARIGTCSKTIQRAQQRLAQLEYIKVELRPVEGEKHDTNVVTIISAEWLTWIAMGKIPKYIGGQNCLSTANSLILKNVIGQLERRRSAVDTPVPVDPRLKEALDRYGGLVRSKSERR